MQSYCRVRLQTADCSRTCRRQNDSIQMTQCMRQFHAFVMNLLAPSRSCTDAHQLSPMHSHPGDTANSDFDFNSAARALNAECKPQEAPLQSSGATSECRPERGLELEVRDFTSECRMQNASGPCI